MRYILDKPRNKLNNLGVNDDFSALDYRAPVLKFSHEVIRTVLRELVDLNRVLYLYNPVVVTFTSSLLSEFRFYVYSLGQLEVRMIPQIDWFPISTIRATMGSRFV